MKLRTLPLTVRWGETLYTVSGLHSFWICLPPYSFIYPRSSVLALFASCLIHQYLAPLHSVSYSDTAANHNLISSLPGWGRRFQIPTGFETTDTCLDQHFLHKQARLLHSYVHVLPSPPLPSALRTSSKDYHYRLHVPWMEEIPGDFWCLCKICFIYKHTSEATRSLPWPPQFSCSLSQSIPIVKCLLQTAISFTPPHFRLLSSAERWWWYHLSPDSERWVIYSHLREKGINNHCDHSKLLPSL